MNLGDSLAELMTDALHAAIVAHASAEAPREACGLVVRACDRVWYLPARNVASEPGSFQMDADSWAAAEDQGDVIALVHSHPHDDPSPSERDLTACRASGVPWWILAHPSGAWQEIAP